MKVQSDWLIFLPIRLNLSIRAFDEISLGVVVEEIGESLSIKKGWMVFDFDVKEFMCPARNQ